MQNDDGTLTTERVEELRDRTEQIRSEYQVAPEPVAPENAQDLRSQSQISNNFLSVLEGTALFLNNGHENADGMVIRIFFHHPVNVIVFLVPIGEIPIPNTV